MAGILQNENAVFYLPCDQLPPQEVVKSQTWTDHGNFSNGGIPSVVLASGIVESGFRAVLTVPPGLITDDFIIAHPSTVYDDLTASSGLCLAYWATGNDITANLAISVGFDNNVGSNIRNGIAVFSSTAFFLSTFYVSGIANFSPLTSETNTNPIFIVVDIRFSGGTTWTERHSLNGSDWTSPAIITTANKFDNSSFVKVAFGANFASRNTVDEIVLWSNCILFTPEELSNLFSLGDTLNEPMTSYAALFGTNTSSGSTNMFLQGSKVETNSLNGESLFIKGSDIAQKSIDLLIIGPTIGNENSTTNLFINGVEPKPSTSCPPLDPTASIQLKPSLITIYQSRIDALINQLGVNVHLEFDPIISPCPNCTFDRIRKRSTGIYIPGGPRPFTRGRRCPYCKGRGLLETSVTKCIKCLSKWNPENAANFGISVSNKKDIVRFKTFLTEADDLVRAKTVLAEFDIVNQLKLRVKLIRGPIPVGLREDRYCISFWELI